MFVANVDGAIFCVTVFGRSDSTTR